MKITAALRLVGVATVGVGLVGATSMVAFAEEGSPLVRVNVTGTGEPTRGQASVLVTESDTAVSDGGRYAVFMTDAWNFLPTGASGFHGFYRDSETGKTIALGKPAGGSGAPSVSRDGRYVAFDRHRRDMQSVGGTAPFAVSSTGEAANDTIQSQVISADGRYVTFVSAATNLVPGDTNGVTDVFVRDMSAQTTTRVSVAAANRQSAGGAGDYCECSMSPVVGGRFVTFVSYAEDLVPNDTNGAGDVFVRDLVARTTTRVSVSDDGGAQAGAVSLHPSITADGRYVVFESDAPNLVAGDTDGRRDIFRRDLLEGTTTLIEFAPASGELERLYSGARISADGRFLSFDTDQSNVVPGDRNARIDVFVRDLLTGVNTRVSVSGSGVEGNGASYRPSVSPDGRFVLFTSGATNLVEGDTNNAPDVFLHRLG